MMIEELKLLANKMGVPYQTLIKIYLSERISKRVGICQCVGGAAQ